MPNPRIFISSTCYDLREQRSAIKSALLDMGYDVVLSEDGDITYDKAVSFEASCHNEISNCDIIVGIIGGRFGSQSKETEPKFSITMGEISKAISDRKLVYIFVAEEVLTEYRTYEKNKDVKGIKWVQVDDTRIYDFLNRISDQEPNVPILSFSFSSEIVSLLSRQLSGALYNFIQNEARLSQSRVALSINYSINRLQRVFDKMNAAMAEFELKDRGFQFALLPAISRILKILGITHYSVIIPTKEGLVEFLENIGFSCESYISELQPQMMVFSKVEGDMIISIKVQNALFLDDGSFDRYKTVEDCEKLISYALSRDGAKKKDRVRLNETVVCNQIIGIK